MLHWFNLELWGPIWPNLAASAICTGAVWWRARIHLRRQHETLTGQVRQMRDEHAERHAQTHALVESLHARLVEAIGGEGSDIEGEG